MSQAPRRPRPCRLWSLCFSGPDLDSRSVALRPRGPSGPGALSPRGSGSGSWVTHRGHVHQSTGGRVGGQGLTGARVCPPPLLEPPGPLIFSLGDLGRGSATSLSVSRFVKVRVKFPPFGADVGAAAFQARVVVENQGWGPGRLHSELGSAARQPPGPRLKGHLPLATTAPTPSRLVKAQTVTRSHAPSWGSRRCCCCGS